MSLTPEQVRKIAKLAKLQLKDDDEAEKYARELSEIMQYVDILQEVDISDTIPTAQVTGLKNITHTDDPSAKEATFSDSISKDTIAVSRQPKELMQIKVPNIL